MMQIPSQRSHAEAFSEPVEHRRSNSAEALTEHVVFAKRDAPESWMENKIRDLQGLGALKDNWNSYGACPISLASLDDAVRLLNWLAHIVGVPEPIVTASPEGNVAFCWNVGDDQASVEAELLGDGKVLFVYTDERDNARDFEREITDARIMLPYLTLWPEDMNM